MCVCVCVCMLECVLELLRACVHEYVWVSMDANMCVRDCV